MSRQCIDYFYYIIILRLYYVYGLSHHFNDVNFLFVIVHEALGFGIMDAEKLVEKARSWKSVPPQISCTVDLKRT